jgi:hypothetical protein
MPPENAGRFSSWRFIIAFVVTILLVAGSYLSWKIYEFRKGEQWVRDVAEGLKQFEREQYDRAMADTYGGKTPEATLQMYIAAVEKGDYELASKLYILENQNTELAEFNAARGTPVEQITKYLNSLKDISKLGGNYSSSGNLFTFNGAVHVQLQRYPNGIWKIIEI